MAVCSAVYGGYVMSDIDLQGCLTIQMFVVEASHTQPDNPDRDRMRKVTLMRRVNTLSGSCPASVGLIRNKVMLRLPKCSISGLLRSAEHTAMTSIYNCLGYRSMFSRFRLSDPRPPNMALGVPPHPLPHDPRKCLAKLS